MIISEVIGGLGNQMFQYAAGWALAKEKETTLKLDITGYSNYFLHQGFELQNVFFADVNVASTADLKTVLGWQSSDIVRRLLKRPYLKSLRKASMLVELSSNFADLASMVDAHGYLSGYWQSEKYFSNYSADIRKQFEFKQPLSFENRRWVDMIEKRNAVSVHVRRGDFINKSNINIHGACSVEYYISGVAYISQHITDAEFFIFSDDMSWARENLRIDAPCFYIENNSGVGSFNDMRLMSRCRHHIAANSSFSWWGAWLNDREKKITIAPKRWFASGMDAKDLIPQSWLRL